MRGWSTGQSLHAAPEGDHVSDHQEPGAIVIWPRWWSVPLRVKVEVVEPPLALALMVPRCEHGNIILGCPFDDCVAQGLYLAEHRRQFNEYYERFSQGLVGAWGIPNHEMGQSYVTIEMLEALRDRWGQEYPLDS